MPVLHENSGSKRVLKTSSVLVFLSAFIVVVLGMAIANLREEITILDDFLASTMDIRPNFEKSLSLYSEGTKKEIDYLLNLRPETEEEYVKFISEVEQIGHDLSLDLEMNSLQVREEKVGANKKFIAYRISFFGTSSELLSFLSRLEALPYLISVESLKFRDLKFIDNLEEKENKNIEMLIQLFVK